MRIKVFMTSREAAQQMFQAVIDAAKALRLQCQISWQADLATLREQLAENRYGQDVYILDPQDPACLEAARLIREVNFLCAVLFLAPPAQRLPALLRYRPSALIAGPEDTQRLRDALLWAHREQSRANPYLTIRNKDAVLRIRYADILWLESRQRIIVAHTRRQEISFYAKLSEVYDLLPRDMFLRCHQSYVVNLGEIERVDKTRRCVLLRGGVTLEISKTYYPDVAAKM